MADDTVDYSHLLRPDHDPARPAVSTAAVASQLGISRQAVIQRIQRGALEGYGVPSRQRVRWYAYADALNSAGTGSEAERRLEVMTSHYHRLQNEVASLQDLLERRERAYRALKSSDEYLMKAHERLREAFCEIDSSVDVFQSRLTDSSVPDSPGQ